MIVDSSKSGFDNLLALLNAGNGTDYTVDDVVFGPPSVYSDPAHPLHNTQITVTGIGDWKGTKTVYYTRLDLDREIQYGSYPSGGYASVAAFLAFVGTQSDIRVDQVQVNLSSIPPAGTEAVAVVSPVADSLLYVGQKQVVFTA